MLRFLGTLVLVPIAAAILNPLALAQPAASAVPESDWGLPADGVQVYIALADPARDTCPPVRRCPQQPALPGEIPHLIVHFRNRGTEPVSFSHDFSRYSTIEVDGRWYRLIGGASASAAIFSVPPGSQTVTVYGVLSGDFVAEGTRDKLALTPGRHLVRLNIRSVANRSPATRPASSAQLVTVATNLALVDIPDLTDAEERQALIAQASVGGTAGLAAARRMAQVFPDSAMEAIEAGARATTDTSQRSGYIDLAAAVPGDDSLAFLRSQLAPEAGLGAQIQAAAALRARNWPDWELPLLDAWRDVRDRVVPARGGDYGKLISFLASYGSTLAIDALAGSSDAPVDTRLAIVQAFMPAGASNSASASDGPTANLVMVVNGAMPGPPEGARGIAVERLLTAALADSEQRFGYRRSFGETSVQDPRVCDAAAFVLALWWPERFEFDWAADAAERDVQIEAIRRELARR